jgi:hypothetical protein
MYQLARTSSLVSILRTAPNLQQALVPITPWEPQYGTALSARADALGLSSASSWRPNVLQHCVDMLACRQDPGTCKGQSSANAAWRLVQARYITYSLLIPWYA